MGTICQYLINCNVINQSVKGWSRSGGALCQPHSSYSSFTVALRKLQGKQQSTKAALGRVWSIPLSLHWQQLYVFLINHRRCPGTHFGFRPAPHRGSVSVRIFVLRLISHACKIMALFFSSCFPPISSLTWWICFPFEIFMSSFAIVFCPECIKMCKKNTYKPKRFQEVMCSPSYSLLPQSLNYYNSSFFLLTLPERTYGCIQFNPPVNSHTPIRAQSTNEIKIIIIKNNDFQLSFDSWYWRSAAETTSNVNQCGVLLDDQYLFWQCWICVFVFII